MIARREAGMALFASAFAMVPSFASAKVTDRPNSERERIMRSLVSGFYEIINSGNWNALPNVLSDDVRMRSNYLNGSDTSPYNSGGNFLGRDKVSKYLARSRDGKSVYWDTKVEEWMVVRGSYLLAWANPLSQNCHGMSCSWEQPIVHAFWIKLEDEIDPDFRPKIADITEVELMMVGTA